MRRLKACVSFVGGLVLATAAVETALRLIEATPLGHVLTVSEVSLYAPDEGAGYALRPNAQGWWKTENRAFIKINDLGLRDAPMAQAKPEGAQRVLVAGNSIVEALQVPLDKTFVQLAEAQLSAAGQAVEVVNMGVSGATPAVIVERLRRHGLPLAPDALIIVAPWSDMSLPGHDDASAYAGYVPGADGRAVISRAFRNGRGFKLRNSQFGQLFYTALDEFRLARVLNSRKNVGLLHEFPKTAL